MDVIVLVGRGQLGTDLSKKINLCGKFVGRPAVFDLLYQSPREPSGGDRRRLLAGVFDGVHPPGGVQHDVTL